MHLPDPPATIRVDHNTETLPPVERYWNPGDETFQDRCRLKLLHRVAQSAGLVRRVLPRSHREHVGILTYHRIADPVFGVPFPTINVTPAQFRRQLQGLLIAGFRFLRLSDVLRARDGGKGRRALPERSVVLTFDDIFDNVFENAWPVLRELQIPSTMFISTGFVDRKEPFQFDPWARRFHENIPAESWRPITHDHLLELQESGLCEFGAHTHTHQDFRDRVDEFAIDVKRGMGELRARYGCSEMPFAFPYGSPRLGFTSAGLMDIVRDSGLTCGLTTGSHTNASRSDPFGWGRFHVFQHDTPLSLEAKLTGAYEWLPQLRSRIMDGMQNRSVLAAT